ncbi:MAG: polysaccharide deacetylase family protein [Anaerolineaceae bacterium]|nr:polysaccharide deacetylase family protein [Anaerolineaceae bacterium]
MKKFIPLLILGMLSSLLLSGCSITQSFIPTVTPTITPTPQPTATPLPPTPTPTPTEIPFYIDATVIPVDQQVPILIYHRFVPEYMDANSMHMRYSEFKNELQTFYDNDFVLVSLYDWIKGTYIVPPGKRPLIITIDDMWYADQLFINEDGTPSDLSALGILYEFSQQHPDFSYHAAVFAIYGDKYYAEKQVGDRFIVSDNATWTTTSWHIKLGNTIAWALEHGIEVYNHTLNHYNLTNLDNSEIQHQLEENDLVMRQFLTEAGQADWIPSLQNIIALPEGKWPANQSGKNTILNYINPEGEAVLAVMEAYNLDAAQFTPSYFSPEFNPLAIARITASPYFVNYIVANKDQLPLTERCQLGPVKQELVGDQAVLQELVSNAVLSGTCPEGVYHISDWIFVARDGMVTLHQP